MEVDESLIVAYVLDGRGGGKRITWEGVRQWQPEQGVLWVHLDYTGSAAQQWLAQESQLDAITVSVLIAEETRPRVVTAKDGLLMTLRGVNLNPGQDPEDMVSIRVWIESHRIITTRHRRLLTVADLCQTIDQGTGPTSPDDFLLTLNARLIDRMADVIENIEQQADDLEDEVMTMESHQLRPRIADLRRQTIMIRRFLSPQKEALLRLYTDEVNLFTPAQKTQLREIGDRLTRYIEELDTVRDRAGITYEVLESRLSEQMNKRMYMLSVAAAIFLPLSFVTGLLGVNVGGIPGGSNEFAFAILTALLIICCIIMVWVLKRKRWI